MSMSNFMGKTLLGAKKLGKAVGKSAGEIGATIGKSATEIGNTIGGAATEFGDYTKKVAKVSMVKAEMDELYFKLGKSVFEDGLMPSNETAMDIMNKLFELDAQVVEMEKAIKASKEAKETPVPTEEVVSEETVSEEIPCVTEDETPCDETPTEVVEDTTEVTENKE